MLTITPFLWFDPQAEEAMQLYTSIFPNSTVHVHRAQGRVMAVEFEIEGQRSRIASGCRGRSCPSGWAPCSVTPIRHARSA